MRVEGGRITVLAGEESVTHVPLQSVTYVPDRFMILDYLCFWDDSSFFGYSDQPIALSNIILYRIPIPIIFCLHLKVIQDFFPIGK